MYAYNKYVLCDVVYFIFIRGKTVIKPKFLAVLYDFIIWLLFYKEQPFLFSEWLISVKSSHILFRVLSNYRFPTGHFSVFCWTFSFFGPFRFPTGHFSVFCWTFSFFGPFRFPSGLFILYSN